MNLKHIGQALVGILAPMHCIICKAQLAEFICDSCYTQLPLLQTHKSSQIQHFMQLGFHDGSLSHTFSLLDYQNKKVKMLVRHIKYAGQAEAGVYAGQYLGHYYKRQSEQEFVLVPIPVAKERLATRGFNQALSLAQGMAMATDWTIVEILAHKNLAQLSHLAGKGRLKRFEFLRSALVAVPELLQPEAHYLLVDDVLTTGATLQAAASALHNVGANSVSAVTLAGIEFM